MENNHLPDIEVIPREITIIPGCPVPPFFSNFEDFFSSLTVDPEVMRQKSVTTGNKINEMKNVFEALEVAVNKTNNYWIGEAGDAHREIFYSAKQEIEEIFLRLSEHARELGEMAAVYSNAESTAAEISEDLPFDVII